LGNAVIPRILDAMKICFMTLACPKWSWEEILLNARRMGYDGLELRFIHDVRNLTQSPEMQPAHLAQTKCQLADAGLAVPCVDTSCSLVKADAAALDLARRHIDIAAALGTPLVRVFGGELPKSNASVPLAPSENNEPDTQAGRSRYPDEIQRALDFAAKNWRALAEYGKTRGVRPILETHDDFTDTNKAMQLLRMAAHENVGILWDAHHPFRFRGEPLAETFARIGPHVFHTHIKDSVALPNGKYRYKLHGQGDVPVRETIELLKASGNQSWLCVEWEKTWHPDLEEPEVALPQYLDGLRRMG
jgi:sugar phosphate isomerase/epimerase